MIERTLLQSEILARLDGREAMTAGELSFLLNEQTPDVQAELKVLVKEGLVHRHHLSDGSLRYSLRPPVIAPQSPSPAPAPVTSGSARLTFGPSLDILVDSAVREIDAIASCSDVAARAAALYGVHRVLNAHMERAALAIVVSESTPRSMP
ncbi:MAG: hypothetical protein J0I77_09485 [Rudaea sp.]|uniref:hypothetical protein n=1 Tax=unclassified Rudaea TaxID=2627037 RepID=UPI0010F9C490|nr:MULTISPECIES: hypothetical protein [unclassified Rudaea]MBN8885939.1 hypothetical protein [Rudaea sp.]MBR0347012.1 hypothetical protein [Rudaea sp.]